MRNFAESVSLQYGDAMVSFYNIKTTLKEPGKSAWHSHRYFELHAVLDGESMYRFPNETVKVSQGQLVIIPPNVQHASPIVFDTKNIEVVSMSIAKCEGDQKFYTVFLDALNNNACRPIALSFTDAKTFGYTELYRSVLGVMKLKQTAANFIDQLFTVLLSNNNPGIVSGKASAVLIDTLVNQPGTTLDEIAEATNYSKRHVTRLIRKIYGMSLSEMRKNRGE